MVRLSIVAVMPLLIWKMRLAPPPLTVTAPFPAPMTLVMLMFLATTNWPLVSVIVCGPAPRLKVTLLFGAVQIFVTASRNVPTPLSAVLVTIGLIEQAVTVCGTVPKLVSKLPSPLYCALMVLPAPGLRPEVVQVATPEPFSVCVLVLPSSQVIGFAPSKNWTVPVGVPGDPTWFAETVAVKKIDSP